MGTSPATRAQAEKQIMDEYVAFLAEDLAGNTADASEHYDEMNRLLEEYPHIPVQRTPSG